MVRCSGTDRESRRMACQRSILVEWCPGKLGRLHSTGHIQLSAALAIWWQLHSLHSFSHSSHFLLLNSALVAVLLAPGAKLGIMVDKDYWLCWQLLLFPLEFACLFTCFVLLWLWLGWCVLVGGVECLFTLEVCIQSLRSALSGRVDDEVVWVASRLDGDVYWLGLYQGCATQRVV